MTGTESRISHSRGSAWQVGFANGRRMGPRLARNIDRYIEAGPGRYTQLDREELRRGALPWLRRLPPRFQEELAGLAAGADLSLQRVAEWCYVEECSSGGCSACLWTVGGRTWVARNNDIWVPDLWGFVTIREVTGRIPTVSFGLEREPFIATGINRECLWLHYNYLPVWDRPTTGKRCLPPYVLLTEALETCRSIADVETLLEGVDRSGGMMIFAVDGKTAKGAILECTCSTYARREAADGWLAGTNHYLARGTPTAAEAYAPSSVRRYERLAKVLGGLNRADGPPDLPWDLIRVLAGPGVEQRDQDYGTVYANVACPASGELWTTLGGYPAASAGTWQRLDWPWP